MPAPITNFAGVGNRNNSAYADASGDIGYDAASGRKYYMQFVETSFQIWDVTDPASPVSVYGPADGYTLFSALGGDCALNNGDWWDPVVNFDHLANRWLVGMYADDGTDTTEPTRYDECVGVSTTADPTGAWNLYSYVLSTTYEPVDLELGVWPDGYYLSFDWADPATWDWFGEGVAAFDRAAMLNGDSAAMILFDVGAVNLQYGYMLPSDLDGAAPPAGSPNHFVEWDDQSWITGAASDALRVWEFHVDWATPANSTFGANSSFDPNYTIPTSNLDFMAACVPQPDTETVLCSYNGSANVRLQYRNFGSYEAIVGNLTVAAGSVPTTFKAPYWFELRDSGLGWALNQAGILAPDGENRFTGSIAMDVAGDMALGYTAASATLHPSIRYAGRLAADTTGTLPQGETSLLESDGSESRSDPNVAPFWGLHSTMSVDPINGCTFWYTQMYMQTTSEHDWGTRIGAFAFPSCVPTRLIISGNAGVAGATLTYDDGGLKTVTTDANGDYGITVPYSWSGTVTPSKTYYTFSPTSLSYDNVTSDQINQDYTATLHTFADVPVTGKEWMEPWIDAFKNAGITTGCGVNPLIYCPENQVTRAEMAVFVERAMNYPALPYTPPPLSHFFGDMPVAGKEWMEAWVDEFYRDGITTGCGVGPIYCPENHVTRAEMAVFILRAIHDPGCAPPTAANPFSDVPVTGKEWMEPWIVEFYNEGITTGCGVDPLRFCPENNVTRAEMAVFIDRAYGLYP